MPNTAGRAGDSGHDVTGYLDEYIRTSEATGAIGPAGAITTHADTRERLRQYAETLLSGPQ